LDETTGDEDSDQLLETSLESGMKSVGEKVRIQECVLLG
jgi:hypothetical protein